MSDMEIVRFGPIRCPHAHDMKVRLDFCKRKCKLMGAAVCPRSPTFEEVVKVETEDEKDGRPIAAR